MGGGGREERERVKERGERGGERKLRGSYWFYFSVGVLTDTEI